MKIRNIMQFFLVFVVLLVIANMGNAKPIPEQCKTNCISQYGSVLGKSPAGIAAYSNCSSDCVIFEPNHYEGIYTGIKWQCVEYARRWLLHEFDVVYGDVDIAADIWGLEKVTNPISLVSYTFTSIVNGATSLPQRGDLLIYGKEYLDTGHVAVVVDIDKQHSTVKVVEQNYLNSSWIGNYSREISYVKNDEHYWLLDEYLIGWKRVLNKQS